jgi:hypothetical protein
VEIVATSAVLAMYLAVLEYRFGEKDCLKSSIDGGWEAVGLALGGVVASASDACEGLMATS